MSTDSKTNHLRAPFRSVAGSDGTTAVGTSGRSSPAPQDGVDSWPWVPHSKTQFQQFYLLSYNILNIFLWGYLLAELAIHLSSSPVRPPTLVNGTNGLVGFLKGFLNNSSTSKGQTTPYGFLGKIVQRAEWTYYYHEMGTYTLLVQSLAVFEVGHAAMKWIKSPLVTTAMQVASRLIIVWIIVEGSDEIVRQTPVYTTMLLAWCFAELIRFSYYSAQSPYLTITTNPSFKSFLTHLTWLRYSAFYILYPLGAGSEWLLILRSFPEYSSRAGVLAYVNSWSILTWFKVALVFIWPASLAMLMSYMAKQRRKTLGGASSSKGRKRKQN